MDEFMDRLASLILNEMGKHNYSYAYFADMCDLSAHEISLIVNKKLSDIKLSTLIKICNNSDILIIDVFGGIDYCSILAVQKDIADNALIVIHGVEYRLTKSNLPDRQK